MIVLRDKSWGERGQIYLSCINDVAKAMYAGGISACDLEETRAIKLIAGMGWIQSHETYARLLRVAEEGRLPFDVTVPNRTTRKAMDELEAGKGKRFDMMRLCQCYIYYVEMNCS